MKKMILGQLLVAMLLLQPANGQAQSLKDLFNKSNIEKVVNSVTGKSTTVDLTGTWTYSGAAIAFESDNLLQKAGGAVAASTAENKLDEQLAKVGIKEGEMTFTFAADSTFTTMVGKKKLSGTYTYDASTQKAELKFAKLVKIGTTLSMTSSTMDMLFESDKLLKLVSFLASKTSNTTLKTIGSLADSYDGMKLGFSMKKNEEGASK